MLSYLRMMGFSTCNHKLAGIWEREARSTSTHSGADRTISELKLLNSFTEEHGIMRLNEFTAIVTSKIVLVPYR